jgi:prepilin-type processing-associated H-X9-DG protein
VKFTIIELVVIVAILLVCMGLIGLWPGVFLWNLLVGWVYFIGRVFPEIQINVAGVLTALVCLSALTGGLHLLLRWCYQQSGSASAAMEPAGRTWPWRWTIAILAIVVLAFVAGISAVGITHQTVWLVTSPEPVLQSSLREAANRFKSSNNLKQIGLALHVHHDKKGAFPGGAVFDREGRMLHGWQTLILPYLEQDDLYRKINLGLPWDHPVNVSNFQTVIPEYLHPAGKSTQDPSGFPLIHYAGNVRLLGGEKSIKETDITDGTSNTIMAGESAGNFRAWGYPANWRDLTLGINASPNGFGGPLAGGANFLFADGSVHFVINSISPELLKALSTPAGGEKVQVP